MPRKTRSEKILAKLRRLESNQTLTTNPTGASETPIPATKIAYEYKSSDSKVVKTATKQDLEDYSYVFSDLRKTFAFVACAVAFEIILRIFIIK